MESRTYYMILGVPNTESASGIRTAYRDLAKRLHPDVAGEQATRAFQEVTEAYGVLSDPKRRAEYNGRLQRSAGGGVTTLRRGTPEPLVRDFKRRGVPNFKPLEGLDFEVLLTPEEASHACVVPVPVPVFRACPQCGGSGRDGAFSCAYCQRSGIVQSEQLLRVWIPPRVPSGSTYEISLQTLGIPQFYLRLHVLLE